MSDNIILVTGGFDPIHSGHIAYINDAATFGRVIVGLNSDEWLKRKKGAAFMPFNERYSVVSSLKNVMCVIKFDDFDGSACDAIYQAKKLFPNNKIVFANGGDRTSDNIPEMKEFSGDSTVSFKFGIGGNNKLNSSSWILSEWKHSTEERKWGKSLTYYESGKSKVKRLLISPGESISMQYHNKRSEMWFVESGNGVVYTMTDSGETPLKEIKLHDFYHVTVGQWHKVANIGQKDLELIEIQYGDECIETDIKRKTI